MTPFPAFDVAVVGGGPAGLAAALAVGRMNRRAVVFEAGVPRTVHAPRYHNYLGFPEGISGQRLLALGHEQAERWGAEFREAAVTGARRTGGRGRERFRLTLADESTVGAAGIVLATGVKDRQPSCGPLYEGTGRGVHYCAICDGREAAGERTAVVGRDANAVAMVGALRDFTADLHLLLDDEEDALDGHSRACLEEWGVEVLPGLLQEAEFEDGTVRFRTPGGPSLEFPHVFLALGVVARTRVAESLGCGLDHDGYVRTDDTGVTSEPFVFAAGDCRGGLKQVTQAMAEGERAAIEVCKALREEDGPARARQGDHREEP
jgi:thioredoxin reductase (NADPH)